MTRLPRRRLRHSSTIAALLFTSLAPAAPPGEKIKATRVWNDRDLAEWATPVVGLNVRPGHYSEREYYNAPAPPYLRTYPVYFPGREPEGYAEFLSTRKPEPLIPPKARTRQEWIQAGQIVFRELDVPLTRSYDPELAAIVRSADAFKEVGAKPDADGTVTGLRWVPTAQGLALSVDSCAGCHTRSMPDGSRVDGAPLAGTGNGILGRLVAKVIGDHFGDTPAQWNWRSSVVPWLHNDPHASIRNMQPPDLRALFRALPQGVFARFNGSPLYPTKVPDLIGIGERRFIDHTATHQLRDEGDIMRYAALVACCDIADFGSHRMFTDAQRKHFFRFTDDVLFALAHYIESLQPPRNPHAGDPRIGTGKEVFLREGCARCHTPPIYTNNKLTLAEGYQPPPDHPLRAHIMHETVGTDPGLALKTRKATGFYKVPSLKGVWYRGRLNHDGSVTSLEEWFDPARLRDDFAPSGFKGAGVERRAVKGHKFGLGLNATEKEALIAFLRSL